MFTVYLSWGLIGYISYDEFVKLEPLSTSWILLFHISNYLLFFVSGNWGCGKRFWVVDGTYLVVSDFVNIYLVFLIIYWCMGNGLS